MPAGVYIRTEKIRKKNSDANKGKHYSPWSEFKKGCIPLNKGIAPSEETKKKMSVVHVGLQSGEKHPLYGKHHSEKTKHQISVSRTGKCCGEESPNWKGGKKLKWARHTAARKQFGFIPLNNCEVDGWVGHHLDLNCVIFIPEELHKSVIHSVTKDKNMDIINDKVYEWFINCYLKENHMK